MPNPRRTSGAGRYLGPVRQLSSVNCALMATGVLTCPEQKPISAGRASAI